MEPYTEDTQPGVKQSIIVAENGEQRPVGKILVNKHHKDIQREDNEYLRSTGNEENAGDQILDDDEESTLRKISVARRPRYSWFMLRKQMSEEETRGREENAMPLLQTQLCSQAEGETGLSLDKEEDLQCGLGSWRPHWLQPFLSKKTFVLAHGITGMCYFTLGSYFTATISTLEKQFKIPSRTSGLISGAWDMGTISSVLLISYFGMRGHKPRIVAAGSVLVAVSCFVRLLPYAIYGPGKDALALTMEYERDAALLSNLSEVDSGGSSSLCRPTEVQEDCSTGSVAASPVPAIIMFLAQFIQGVGCSVYWTLGLTYLDDNVTKDKAPLAHTTTQCLRLLGPTFGFTLASYTLSKYVEPSLTPRIDNSDPRWIGGWWIGWPPLGCIVLLLSFIMVLFPRQLPRAARRRAEQLKSKVSPPVISKSIFHAFHRLLKNRTLMFNTFGSVCFMFGNIGYWIFMPKYMETMYHQSSSRASLLTGSIGLASAGLGLVTSGIVISRHKPRARYVALWNIIVEVVDALCKFGWVFLDCGERNLQGHWEENGTWNLTSECNIACDCGPDVKYSPVCSIEGDASFFSPCHAGCNSTEIFSNGTKIFNNCSCIPEGIAIEGPCAMNCVTNFTIFLVSQCIMSFLGASGKAGNILIQMRCVHEDDKPLAIALAEFLACGLAFIPAPIIFGVLLDSTCLVWGTTCGSSGNCWVYSDKRLRYLLNLTGTGFMVAGIILDVGVWYHVKNLQIYDEEEANNKKEDVSSNGLAMERDS